PTRALYDELMATLRLPFVNTDYRALARWPSYFALAWQDLKPALATPAYEQLAQTIHAEASALADALPNPGGLDAQALIDAARRDGNPDATLGTVRLFQWLLPGLTANVAFLRAQLC